MVEKKQIKEKEGKREAGWRGGGDKSNAQFLGLVKVQASAAPEAPDAARVA